MDEHIPPAGDACDPADLYELLPCGIYESLPEGRFLRVNRALVRILGYDSAAELMQVDIGRDLYVEPDRRRELLTLLDERDHLDGELLRFRRKDGSEVLLLEHVRARRDPDGRVRSLVGTLADITARESDRARLGRLNAELEVLVRERTGELERRARFIEALLDAIPNGVFFKDAAGRYLGCNRSFSELVGRDPSEIVGRTVFDLWPPDLAQIYHERDQELLAAPGRQVYESAVTSADGSRLEVVFSKDVFRDEVGRVAGVVGVFTDLSEIRTAQRRTQEAAALLREAVEHNPTGCIVLASSGQLRLINRAAAEILGFAAGSDIPPPADDADGAGWWIEDPECGPLDRNAAPLEMAIRQGETVRNRELVIHRRDGSSRRVLVNASPIRGPGGVILAGVVVFADITEVRQLEARLRRAERLQALGQLAGGIAHDFNHLLQVVRSAAELLRRSPHLGAAERDDLAAIEHATAAAAELSRSLLAFARRQVLRRELLEPERVLPSVLSLLGRLLPATISLEWWVAPDVGWLWVDRGSLEQILINLCVNARDAMPDGGVLRVAVERVELDDGFVRANPGSQAGRYIRITVTDTGIGMDPETAARALEPFFTTRRSSGGTGLGLTAVYGAVKQHDGYLRINTSAGDGTTVEAYLPQADGPSSPQAAESVAVNGAAGIAGGTVLVVEDHDDLRRILVRSIENLGLVAMAAEDGGAAQDLLAAHGDTIDLVVTDLALPVLEGGVLFEWLRERWPELPVIVCSGDRGQLDGAEGIAERPATAALAKPFELAELERLVQEMIATRRSR